MAIAPEIIQRGVTPEVKGSDLDKIGEYQRTLIDSGHLSQAESLLKAWLPSHITERNAFIRRLELARVLFWRGKPSESAQHLQEVIRSHPDESWACSMMGQVAVRMGNHEYARRMFARALEIDPSNHEAITFTRGNVVRQIEQARRLLREKRLQQRDRIGFAELCQAIDFKMDTKCNLEKGEISQQYFDRANLMLDDAEVGHEVDSETTLRARLNSAEDVVFYTSMAMGDAILGVGAIQALMRYFDMHPDKRKPIEIVTPYPQFFTGFLEQYPYNKYPYLKIKQLGGPRDPNEPQLYANDLRTRTRKSFIMTNSGDATYNAIDAARSSNTTAVVDVFVDRFSKWKEPWKSPKNNQNVINSYPAKIFRFVEMMIGEKLAVDPNSQTAQLPVSSEMGRLARAMATKYNLRTNFHCIIESASQLSKKFDNQQLTEILTKMSTDSRFRAENAKIVFIKDPSSTDLFVQRINALPLDIRNRIVVVEADLASVASLITLSSSVISPDTGLAHFAGAVGKKTLMITTMADPFLWVTGGKNVRNLYSEQAMQAHRNLTPVYQPEWDTIQPITATSFTAQEIVDGWKRLVYTP